MTGSAIYSAVPLVSNMSNRESPTFTPGFEAATPEKQEKQLHPRRAGGTPEAEDCRDHHEPMKGRRLNA